MKKIAYYALACAFLSNLATSPAPAQTDVEELFSQANLKYTMLDTGFYSFPYEVDDETITVYATARTLYDAAPVESRTLILWTKTLSLPKTFNLTVPFLTTMSQLNDNVPYGSYSLDEKKQVILSNIALQMKDAQRERLNMMCWTLYAMRGRLRTALLPFLDEG